MLQAKGLDKMKMSEQDLEDLASSVRKCYNYQVMAQKLQNHVYYLNQLVDTQTDECSENDPIRNHLQLTLLE